MCNKNVNNISINVLTGHGSDKNYLPGQPPSKADISVESRLTVSFDFVGYMSAFVGLCQIDLLEY